MMNFSHHTPHKMQATLENTLTPIRIKSNMTSIQKPLKIGLYRRLLLLVLCIFSFQSYESEAFVISPTGRATRFHASGWASKTLPRTTTKENDHQSRKMVSPLSSTVSPYFTVDSFLATPPTVVNEIGQSVRSMVTLVLGGTGILFLLLVTVIIFTITAMEQSMESVMGLEDVVEKYYPQVWRELRDEYGDDFEAEHFIETPEAFEFLCDRMEHRVKDTNVVMEELLQRKYPDIWEDYREQLETHETTTTALERGALLRAIWEQEKIQESLESMIEQATTKQGTQS